MPRQISQELVSEAILDGFDNAQKAYKQWSGGWVLSSSAEHVVYVFIAMAIRKIPGTKYLRIERSCKDVRRDACGNRPGQPAQALRLNGHIDIVLSWANDKPRAIIEIKNNVYNYEGQCKRDIERITTLLRSRPTTLQFGIFAFYSSATNGRKTAKEKLEKRFNSIMSRIKVAYGESFKVSGIQRVRDYDNSAWACSCIVMKPYK